MADNAEIVSAAPNGGEQMDNPVTMHDMNAALQTMCKQICDTLLHSQAASFQTHAILQQKCSDDSGRGQNRPATEDACPGTSKVHVSDSNEITPTVSYDLLSDSESDDDSEEGGANNAIDEILKSVSDLYADEDNLKKDVFTKLADNVNLCFRKRLSKEHKKTLINNYGRPQNCKHLYIPKINGVVWDITKANTRSRDIRLSQVQKLLGKAAIPIIENAQSLYDVSTEWLLGDDIEKRMKELNEAKKLEKALERESSDRKHGGYGSRFITHNKNWITGKGGQKHNGTGKSFLSKGQRFKGNKFR